MHIHQLHCILLCLNNGISYLSYLIYDTIDLDSDPAISCSIPDISCSIFQYMLVDLDNNKLTCSVLHESTVLPKKITKALSNALKLAQGKVNCVHHYVRTTILHGICISNIDESWNELMCILDANVDSANAIISDSFLRLFVETTGNYRECIEAQDDDTRIFHVRKTSQSLCIAFE